MTAAVFGSVFGAANPGVSADFSQDNGWVWLIKAVVILVFLLLTVLLAIWFERKVVGRMQVRPGPNVHGPFGLLQSLADAMKLLLKEDITVKAADKFLYLLAPMISVFTALLTFVVRLFVPESEKWQAAVKSSTTKIEPLKEIFGPTLWKTTRP